MDYLGGVPTTNPAKIAVGDTPEQMITNDMLAEEEAIAFYKTVIETANKEKDYVTRELFLGILADEEEHHNVFKGLLEK